MNENENVKQKSNKGLIVLVIILLIMVLGLGGYIINDKIISNNETEDVVVEDINDETDNSLPSITEYFPVSADIKSFYEGKSENVLNSNEETEEEKVSEEVQIALYDNGEFIVRDNNYYVGYGYAGYYEEKDDYFILYSLYDLGSDVSAIKRDSIKKIILYKDDNNKLLYSSTAGLDENITLSKSNYNNEFDNYVKTIELQD